MLRASPQCNLQRLGAVVLGADGQRVLQEAEGKVVLHHPVEHQPDVVLHRETMEALRKGEFKPCSHCKTTQVLHRWKGRKAPAGIPIARGRKQLCPWELSPNKRDESKK